MLPMVAACLASVAYRASSGLPIRGRWGSAPTRGAGCTIRSGVPTRCTWKTWRRNLVTCPLLFPARHCHGRRGWPPRSISLVSAMTCRTDRRRAFRRCSSGVPTRFWRKGRCSTPSGQRLGPIDGCEASGQRRSRKGCVRLVQKESARRLPGETGAVEPSHATMRTFRCAGIEGATGDGNDRSCAA